MATAYVVFPDSREAVRVPGTLGMFDATAGTFDGPSAEMLETLHALNWDHQVTVVFKEDGDDRWSFDILVPRPQEDPDA
jgi:hypothetical protein